MLCRDDRFDARPYGAKVGEIIKRHLSVQGVEQLLAPRDILDPAFKNHLDSLTSAEANAAEIEHAIRHEIHIHRDENPAAYASLWEQQMRRAIKERLRAIGMNAAKIEAATAKVMDVARARLAR